MINQDKREVQIVIFSITFNLSPSTESKIVFAQKFDSQQSFRQ